MELKRHSNLFAFNNLIVLIVPYGIETLNKSKYASVVDDVLIVPYGIETCRSDEVER